MACKLCQWLTKRFSKTDESLCASKWRELSDWERAYLSAIDGFGEEPDATLHLVNSAGDLHDHDPASAFELYREAAAAGSALAIEVLGWHYEIGKVVPVDLPEAERTYHRAICAGSWSATLRYAKLLAKRGELAGCESVLRDGVELEFVPAFFWLAWYRYKWRPTRATAWEIAPLLEHADARGHPMARKFLGALMLRGKFGIRQIPDGLRVILSEDPRSDADIVRSVAPGGVTAG